MTTNAPPAYSSVDAAPGGEGGQNPSAPPSYDGGAPAYQPASAPPAFNPSVNANPAPAVVSQPQPAIQYVDQYGNPIQMQQVSQPQPIIKYVDQFGNPVAPPTGAGVQYVAQQPAIKYVDQFGNPVAPPQSANVQYISPQAQPLKPVVTAAAAPPTAKPIVAATAKAPYTAPVTESQRQQANAAFGLGLLSLLMLIIALATDSLAKGTMSASTTTVSLTCGWSEVSSPFSELSSYDDLCDAERAASDSSLYSTESTYDSGTNWCGAQTCATLAMVCTIMSMVFTALGAYITNTCCKVDNPSCRCSRTVYILSAVTGILGIIIWSAGNEMCSDRYWDDLYGSYTSDVSTSWGWGSSIICLLIGSILSGMAGCLAK